jgi:site-specific DNA-methyltransferase (adenine-specific)
MARFETLFHSDRQDWTTPPEVFDPLHREFCFDLDAAASADNSLAPSFISKEEDALRTEWGEGRRVWVNPPFGTKGNGSLKQWVTRAYEQSRKGNLVVILIPARTNTTWFHDICLTHGEVRFIKGRPKFGGAKHGLPWPLCLIVFNGLQTPERA